MISTYYYYYLCIAYLQLYTRNRVPRVCNFVALLWLQCMANVILCLMRNEMNFYITTFRNSVFSAE